MFISLLLMWSSLCDSVDRGVLDRVLSSVGLPGWFRNAYFEYHAHVRLCGRSEFTAREQDSSVGGGTGNNCLGVVHMEEGAQVRVQVEVGSEEQGEAETHREGQN